MHTLPTFRLLKLKIVIVRCHGEQDEIKVINIISISIGAHYNYNFRKD
jgi:hypothetical protein